MNAVSTDRPGPSGRIWFALLGAPAAWSIQEIVSWLLADFVCTASDALAETALRAAAIIVSAAALVTAVAAFIVALAAWRRSSESNLVSLQAATRPDFLAIAAVFVSASFTLGILWAGLGPFMLPLCERTR